MNIVLYKPSWFFNPFGSTILQLYFTLNYFFAIICVTNLLIYQKEEIQHNFLSIKCLI